MNAPASGAQTRAIVIEDTLPHDPAVVWRVLTTPDLIARWLMKNDFAPKVGHRFSFEGQPVGDWDGHVRCEVLELDEPRRLVYSWAGGNLDSTLTFTLTPVDGGTRLRMVHDGFRSPQNDAGYAMMSNGWASIARRIDALARDL